MKKGPTENIFSISLSRFLKIYYVLGKGGKPKPSKNFETFIDGSAKEVGSHPVLVIFLREACIDFDLI